MYLSKDSGGTTLTHCGKPYTWKEDGDVVEVPAEFGEQLLAIRGGGFHEAEKPASAPKADQPKTGALPAKDSGTK